MAFARNYVLIFCFCTILRKQSIRMNFAWNSIHVYFKEQAKNTLLCVQVLHLKCRKCKNKIDAKKHIHQIFHSIENCMFGVDCVGFVCVCVSGVFVFWKLEMVSAFHSKSIGNVHFAWTISPLMSKVRFSSLHCWIFQALRMHIALD